MKLQVSFTALFFLGLFTGPAESTTACDGVTCDFHGLCVEKDGNATCQCSLACPLSYFPVCGSDGKTYSNDCVMKSQSCVQKVNITTVAQGSCPVQATTAAPTVAAKDPCASVTCQHYGTCIASSGVGKCQCPLVCPAIYAPVCASNEKTYASECEMKAESCTKAITITKGSDGACPCDNHKCDYNAQCINQQGTAVCECPKMCTFEYRPLCGSDGKTYSNDCQMKVASCNGKIAISIASNGVCPCDTKKCQSYEICLNNQGNATCTCRLGCPRIYRPLCGSDGKTYPNDCVMNAAACTAKSMLTKESDGPCPCDSHKCDYNAQCVNKQGQASCQCPLMCTMDYTPVCGSDGKTYSNLCSMNVAACNAKIELSVSSQGACPDPCASHKCDYNAQCVNKQGQASCQCPLICTLEYAPVCGSNGKTYSNLCSMKVAGCNAKMELSVSSQGVCPCDTKTCQFDARCVNNKGTAECNCMIPCPRNLMPVCGSDGKTYDNECTMRVASCEQQKVITMAHQGRCEEQGNDSDELDDPTDGAIQLSVSISLLMGILSVFALA